MWPTQASLSRYQQTLVLQVSSTSAASLIIITRLVEEYCVFKQVAAVKTAFMYLPVLTFTFISLSSRLETIMCGVLYLCLLGHLRNSLIPHLQPICPHPLQTARKPQAAALPLSGWSTVRLVDCLYFSLYMNCCGFRHLMPNDMLLVFHHSFNQLCHQYLWESCVFARSHSSWNTFV